MVHRRTAATSHAWVWYLSAVTACSPALAAPIASAVLRNPLLRSLARPVSCCSHECTTSNRFAYRASCCLRVVVYTRRRYPTTADNTHHITPSTRGASSTPAQQGKRLSSAGSFYNTRLDQQVVEPKSKSNTFRPQQTSRASERSPPA